MGVALNYIQKLTRDELLGLILDAHDWYRITPYTYLLSEGNAKDGYKLTGVNLSNHEYYCFEGKYDSEEITATLAIFAELFKRPGFKITKKYGQQRQLKKQLSSRSNLLNS